MSYPSSKAFCRPYSIVPFTFKCSNSHSTPGLVANCVCPHRGMIRNILIAMRFVKYSCLSTRGKWVSPHLSDSAHFSCSHIGSPFYGSFMEVAPRNWYLCLVPSANDQYDAQRTMPFSRTSPVWILDWLGKLFLAAIPKLDHPWISSASRSVLSLEKINLAGLRVECPK